MTLAFDDPPDDQRRRRLLWAMPTGIYVLGSTAGPGGPVHLMTHSLAMQASVEPCVVAVSVEATAMTHGLMEATKVAALSVLRRDQRELVRRFVKRVDDVEVLDDGTVVAMAGVAVAVAPSGAPYVAGALGCLDLAVIDARGFASHTVFFCEVTAIAVAPEVLEGPASARTAEVLRMEDTKMNYGG